MPLPILNQPVVADVSTLIRYYHKTDAHWGAHLAEPVEQDFGTVYCNGQLPRVWESNCVRDARVPEGMNAAQVVALAHEQFALQNSTCWIWVCNPSAPESQTRPLVEHLLEQNHRALVSDIMYMDRMPDRPVVEVPGLRIIPARASFRHARELALESAQKWDCPQIADADMLHLDDPHWDCLLALKDGQAVATAGVLSVGEIGRIENVFVTASLRHQGVGRTMMSRCLEICARSLFKHIFLCVFSDNAPAKKLYAQLGFKKIGQFTSYVRQDRIES